MHTNIHFTLRLQIIGKSCWGYLTPHHYRRFSFSSLLIKEKQKDNLKRNRKNYEHNINIKICKI